MFPRPMRSHLIDLSGPVHVIDHGGRGTPIILVHGLGGSAENWMRVGPGLAETHRVWAPDLVGFGRTPLAGRSPSLEGNAELLARFVERVAGGPAVLMGNSMGGLLSLRLASERPDLVRAVVALNPALPLQVGMRLDPAVATLFALYGVPVLGEAFLRVARKRQSAWEAGKAMLRLCGVDTDALPPDVVDAHRDVVEYRQSLPWTIEAFLRAERSVLRALAGRGRMEAMLRGVRAPTLLIHGARDRLVPVDAARAAAKRHAHWTYTELDAAGHTPMIEAPDDVLRVVRAWPGLSPTA